MKKLIYVSILLASIACKKEEKDQPKSELGSAIENITNVGKMSASVDDVKNNMEELKTKTPVTNEELKAMIPENLYGLKRTEINIGSMSVMALQSAEATYKSDQKKININIIDGAGEAGGGFISVLMMTLNADMEKTTENGFEKTQEINGTKAFVSERKSGDNIDSEIKLIQKGRYMIDASGDGLTVEELAKAISEIDFSKLP